MQINNLQLFLNSYFMAEKDIKQNELGSQKRDTTSYKLITEMATFSLSVDAAVQSPTFHLHAHVVEKFKKKIYTNLNKENQCLFYVL